MMEQFFLPFVVTVLTGVVLMLTQRWHGHLSLDSDLGVQKLHTRPTIRVGGVAIAAGIVAVWLGSDASSDDLLGPMLIAGIPAFAAGLCEDVTKNVGVPIRLFATIASGLLAWALTGVAMQDTGLWALDFLLQWWPIAVAFTAFVVSGVANATNIIDGFNGLAAGTVAIMLSAMGVMALGVDDTAVANVAFALALVSLGFVVTNWPLGHIFMGDGGAYLLGFLVAWIAILLPMRHEDINGWATLLACAYPVIEVLYSIRRRMKRRGHHPGAPDVSHMHHFLNRRLIRKWFPRCSRPIQNGLTGTAVWILALIPALWAMIFAQHTAMLVMGFGLAVFGYLALYARLTQFVWCFQAATMSGRRAVTQY